MATEEIRGIPFDSRLQIAEDGTQYEDREVFSADIAKYFGHISSDGICIPRGEALGDDLKVDPSTGGVITINTGAIKIQGRIGWVEEQITIQLDSGGSKPRYDTVVIELNLNTAERRFIAKVIKGEEADEPVPPELTRTSTVYQLGLADVYRVANSTVTGTITDTRENNERCGISSVNAPFGTLGIPDGGTGATTVAGARNALGLGNTSGALPIANGGTGKTTALEALLALGGIQIKKLWENASPTSAFSNQTINLDMTGYSLIKIQFNLDTNKRALPSFDSPTGRACFYESSGYTRHFAISTDKITFTDASNAGAIIPSVIYGIKGVL